MEHALNGVDLISLLLFGGSRLNQDEKMNFWKCILRARMCGRILKMNRCKDCDVRATRLLDCVCPVSVEVAIPSADSRLISLCELDLIKVHKEPKDE